MFGGMSGSAARSRHQDGLILLRCMSAELALAPFKGTAG